VKPPREAKHDRVLERPPFGTQSESERKRPPRAPRYQKPGEREKGPSEQPAQAAPAPQRHERAARPDRVEPPKPERSERARPEVSERARPEGSERAKPEVRDRARPEVSERARPAGTERGAARGTARSRGQDWRSPRSETGAARAAGEPANRVIAASAASRTFRCRASMRRRRAVAAFERSREEHGVGGKGHGDGGFGDAEHGSGR
jgi:hypothetical protein